MNMQSIEAICKESKRLCKKARVLLLFAAVTAASSLSAERVFAQTFAEWFDQKNTQRKYLIQQIAALQAYESVLKSGYNFAHNGLGSISNSGKAELNLHTGYYNGLKTVSPVVKNNPHIKEILAWQQDILTLFRGLDNNNTYEQQVATAVLTDCSKQLTELQHITADNRAQMSDAERIKAIDRVHSAMFGNYSFAIHFCDQVKTLNMQRSLETNDANILKQYYGNH
jgi:hypothetical protein